MPNVGYVFTHASRFVGRGMSQPAVGNLQIFHKFHELLIDFIKYKFSVNITIC